MLSIIFNRGSKDIENANYVFSPDTYFKYICIKNSGNIIHNYVDFLKEFQEVDIFEG